jgi:hypothetical protein
VCVRVQKTSPAVCVYVCVMRVWVCVCVCMGVLCVYVYGRFIVTILGR